MPSKHLVPSYFTAAKPKLTSKQINDARISKVAAGRNLPPAPEPIEESGATHSVLLHLPVAILKRIDIVTLKRGLEAIESPGVGRISRTSTVLYLLVKGLEAEEAPPIPAPEPTVTAPKKKRTTK